MMVKSLRTLKTPVSWMQILSKYHSNYTNQFSDNLVLVVTLARKFISVIIIVMRFLECSEIFHFHRVDTLSRRFRS